MRLCLYLVLLLVLGVAACGLQIAACGLRFGGCGLRYVFLNLYIGKDNWGTRRPGRTLAAAGLAQAGLGPNIRIDPQDACWHVRCVRGDSQRF